MVLTVTGLLKTFQVYVFRLSVSNSPFASYRTVTPGIDVNRLVDDEYIGEKEENLCCDSLD